jgi:dCMP deaminase
MSRAVRLQVGCIIVKDDNIISFSWNGTPRGWDNNCEDESVELYSGYEGAIHRTVLKTKPEVLHAESNAVSKLAKSTNSGLGADLFVTHSPCLECAKLIYQSVIRRVYYCENYRDDAGLQFLYKSGLIVEKLDV